MPIPPKPYKLKCQKCNYSKTVKPKSDTDVMAMIPLGGCPKCAGELERKELGTIASLLGAVFR